MRQIHLNEIYHLYIACLNNQDWDKLGTFISNDVRYNEKLISLAGYRAMLEGDFLAIPDLRFEIEILISDENHVASRLQFDCTPHGRLFGMDVNGKRIKFSENVIYQFRDHKIVSVWSVIDKAAIAAQL
jgi:predicted ester cyclase